MSNVASIELCKELWELSGRTWHEEIIFSWHKDDGEYVIEDFWTGSICPAYDAGYLLRKLPHEIVEKPAPTTYEHYSLRLGAETSGEWYANYWMFDTPLISLSDIEPYNTPEDSLAKLAIELHKVGILPISGRDL